MRASKRMIADPCWNPFYMFICFLTYADSLYGWLVIAASNDHIATSDGAKQMLLGMSALKILVDFDDLVAAFFLKFIVKPTEDGFDLLKAPGYTL